MDLMLDFFNQTLSFFDSSITEHLDGFFQRAAAYIILFYFKIKLYSLTFSYEIATMFLDSINFSSQVESAYGKLPSDVLNTLSFFKIPESLNTIFSALVTRFILDVF